MTFLSPWALLLLALLPALLLLLRPRRPRRPQRVSRLALWDRESQGVRALRWRRRVDRHRLLILQLAIFTLVVLALARPVVRRTAPAGRTTLLLIDASGSMNALENGVSRLTLAQREARRLIDRMDAGDRARIAVARGRLEHSTPFTTDRAVLRGAVEAIAPSHAEVDLAAAVRRLLAAAGPELDELVVLSDAAGEPASPGAQGAGLRMVRIGASADNLAIRRMVTRPDAVSPFDREILVEVASFSPRRRRAELSVRLADGPLLTESFALEPAQRRSFFVTAPAFANQVVTAELAIDDDLEHDDRALELIGETRTLSVLLVTDGNRYLDRALEVDPLCEVTVVRPDSGWESDAESFDLLVLDRVAAATTAMTEMDRGRLLAILPAAGEAKLGGRLRITDRSHPLAAVAGLENLFVEGAVEVPAGPGAVGFLAVAGRPVAASHAADDLRWVGLGFDLRQGEVPYSVSFPLFVARIVRWLGASSGGGDRIAAGQPFSARLDAAAGVGEARVRDPSGEVHRVPVDGDGRFVFAATDRAGLYTVSAGGEERKFVVVALSDRESNIAPGARWKAEPPRRAAAAAPERPPFALARPLLLVAIALLLGEWLLAFPRRRSSGSLAAGPAPR